MDENTKKYNFEGTVTISTDEYRDLITERAELKSQLSEMSSKKSEYYWETERLKKENETLEEKSKEMQGFINSSEEIKTKFKLWKLENMEREDDYGED